MSVSVILRLLERSLASGQLAGEVEIVGTGERAVVATTEDLVRFLLAKHTDETNQGGTP